MRVLTVIFAISILSSSCSTQSAAPIAPQEKHKVDAIPTMDVKTAIDVINIEETVVYEEETTAAIDMQKLQINETSEAVLDDKEELKEIEAVAVTEKEYNVNLKEKTMVAPKRDKTTLKEKHTISFNNKVVTINDVDFILKSAFMEKADKTTKEAKILRNLANQENAYFQSNISFRAKEVTKKLKGKYEYEIFIKNQNRILTLDNIELKIEYKGKRNQDLGGTKIVRNVNLQPGEYVIIDWGIDWAFLEDGTRKCTFTISAVENNLDVFSVVKDIN